MGKTLQDLKIENMYLPEETQKILKEAGFHSVGDLCIGVEQIYKRTNQALPKKEIKRIKNRADSWGEAEGFSREKIENKVGNLVSLDEAANLIGMSKKNIIHLLANDKDNRFSNLCFVVGRNIISENSTKTALVVFNEIEKFKKRYKTIDEISQENGFPFFSLQNYVEYGWMNEARIAKGWWDSNWIKDNYDKLKKRAMENHSRSFSVDYMAVLNEPQRQLILSYIKHRTNKPILFGGITIAPFKSIDSPEEYISRCSRMFYVFICNRSGIKNWAETEGSFRYRELTPEEREQFIPDLFDFDKLTSKDIAAYVDNKSGVTSFNHRAYIRGLFYYTMMLKDEDLDEEEDEAGFENVEERKNLAYKVWRFEKALNRHMNRINSQPKTERVSLFLNRSQIVQMITNVYNSNLQDPLKCTAMLALAFLSCIRPVEMQRLEIDKHFDIDKKTGLLKLHQVKSFDGKTEYSFGRMTITKEISKMQLSPSGRFGTLLMPKVVQYLNLYLESLYKKYPQTRGKGFLFRTNQFEEFADRGYASARTLVRWMTQHKNLFDGILSDEEIEHFSSYDTRHTGNNLIAKKTYLNNTILNDFKQDAAEYHSRHTGGGGVNKTKYQQGFKKRNSTVDSEEMLAEILNAALNFPFDLAELTKWEKDMLKIGGFDVEDKDKENYKLPKPPAPVELSAEEKQLIFELEKEISTLQYERKKLNKAVKMNMDKRIKKAREIDTQIEFKEQEIKRIESKEPVATR
jgi:integrase